MSTAELKSALKELPAEERWRIVREVEEECLDECEVSPGLHETLNRRMQEIREGTVEMINADEVLAGLDEICSHYGANKDPE